MPTTETCFECDGTGKVLAGSRAAMEQRRDELKAHVEWLETELQTVEAQRNRAVDDCTKLLVERSCAEQERDKAQRLLESLTPGGSEFHRDPEACVRFVRARVETSARLAMDARLATGGRLAERVRGAEARAEEALEDTRRMDALRVVESARAEAAEDQLDGARRANAKLRADLRDAMARAERPEAALRKIERVVFDRSGYWVDGDDPVTELAQLWVKVRDIARAALTDAPKPVCELDRCTECPEESTCEAVEPHPCPECERLRGVLFKAGSMVNSGTVGARELLETISEGLEPNAALADAPEREKTAECPSCGGMMPCYPCGEPPTSGREEPS